MSKTSFKIKESLSLATKDTSNETNSFFESFESGSFLTNSWIVLNSPSSPNEWRIGTATAQTGSYSAYISNNLGVSNAYSNSVTTCVWLYKDILIPESATLSFYYKLIGESGFDTGRIIIDPTLTVTPIAGTDITTTPAGGSNTVLNSSVNIWTNRTADLSAYSGTTIRIIFGWRNDLSIGTQPPIAIDNIKIGKKAYTSGQIIKDTDNYIKYYDGTQLNIIGINSVDVVLRNQYDYAGNSYTEAIPQFPWTSPVKLADMTSLPGGQSNDVSVSANGEYLAVCTTTTTNLRIWKRSGVTFTPATVNAPPSATSTLSSSFSPNGKIVATGFVGSPYLALYTKPENPSLSEFQNSTFISTTPTGTVNSCAWSPNGELLVAAHNTTPFISIYQVPPAGSSPTKLADPVTLPTGNARGAAWSPNGEFLVITHEVSPYITIYQRSGTTFTKLADPSTLLAGACYKASWSSDGEFLSIAMDVSPYIVIYQRSGTTFTRLSNPSILPTGGGRAVAWSPSGKMLAIAHLVSPYITIYARSGTTFTKQANPTTLPTGSGRGCTFSFNGEFLHVVHSTSPFITIYQTLSDIEDNSIIKIVNPKLGQS
jgi:6-phosphogluconolactonase (cycloisomerase 2 family)